jgi:peptide/nickel transport system permease protein
VGGMAIPGFWLGIILIYVFAVWHHWLPPSGYVPLTENLQESLRRMILPGMTVASWLTVPLMRQLRASLIEVLQNDYIRTARSKGLSERRVLTGHAFRNALIPVLTVLGGIVGHLYAGTVIGETIFSIPGLGKLVVDSISFRDFPVTQGVVLLAAASVLLATLVTDILYAYVDPRVRYG